MPKGIVSREKFMQMVDEGRDQGLTASQIMQGIQNRGWEVEGLSGNLGSPDSATTQIMQHQGVGPALWHVILHGLPALAGVAVGGAVDAPLAGAAPWFMRALAGPVAAGVAQGGTELGRQALEHERMNLPQAGVQAGMGAGGQLAFGQALPWGMQQGAEGLAKLALNPKAELLRDFPDVIQTWLKQGQLPTKAGLRKGGQAIENAAAARAGTLARGAGITAPSDQILAAPNTEAQVMNERGAPDLDALKRFVAGKQAAHMQPGPNVQTPITFNGKQFVDQYGFPAFTMKPGPDVPADLTLEDLVKLRSGQRRLGGDIQGQRNAGIPLEAGGVEQRAADEAKRNAGAFLHSLPNGLGDQLLQQDLALSRATAAHRLVEQAMMPERAAPGLSASEGGHRMFMRMYIPHGLIPKTPLAVAAQGLNNPYFQALMANGPRLAMPYLGGAADTTGNAQMMQNLMQPLPQPGGYQP